jgi:hypothetical protein
MTEQETFCRSEATRRGITGDIAVWVANSEGKLLTPEGQTGKFSTGWSFWAFQLHYGGAGYERFGTTAGMGNSFTALTGWQPGDPLAWRDAMRYALDEARRGGWGPWYGAKAIGVTGFYGIDRSVPWNGTPADEWDYKKRGQTVADVTAIQQRVIEWGRSKIGKPYAGPLSDFPQSDRFGGPGPHDGYDCSSFVSEAYKAATNGQITLTPFTDAAYDQCEWVQQPQPGDVVFYHYGDASQSGVKFPHVGIWLSTSEVLDCRYPMGVGVHPHVTPVGPLPDGRYRQTMRPKGLASVVIAPPPDPTVDPRDAEIASLKAQLDDARSKLGVASVDYANGLQNLVDALRKFNPAA